MTHLILHKVRGQPAFDIAERCDDMGTAEDPGPWWIISTSGHRAYPYKIFPLANVRANSVGLDLLIDPIPDDWPDHYQAKEQSFDIGEILAGLMKPIGKFLRRA
jgi:hypothetical protein